MIGSGHPGGLHVTLMDGDTISPTNCVRQPFSRSETGSHKVYVLVNRLNIFWGVDWDAVPAHLGPRDRIERADTVIGCVDTRAARAAIQAATTNQSDVDYWLDLGNNTDTGQFVLGEPLNRVSRRKRIRLRSVAELYPAIVDPELDDDGEPSCSAAEALERQEAFLNQVLAQPLLLFSHGFSGTEVSPTTAAFSCRMAGPADCRLTRTFGGELDGAELCETELIAAGRLNTVRPLWDRHWLRIRKAANGAKASLLLVPFHSVDGDGQLGVNRTGESTEVSWRGLPLSFRRRFKAVLPQNVGNGAASDLVAELGQCSLDSPIASISVLGGHTDHQTFDLVSGARTAGAALQAALIFLGDQATVPSQECRRRHDGGYFMEQAPAQFLGPDCQTSALVIVKAKSLTSELLAQHAVLFLKTVDHILLTLVQPASDGDQEQPKRINCQAHRAIVAPR
jgi:PRTRC genetic system ThiF family protein